MSHRPSSRPPEQTTLPVSSLRGPACAARQLTIRWVFPDTVFTKITRETKVLGRDESCDTVLCGSQTSRHHAEVRLQGSDATIRDLGSRNGVAVNGAKVAVSPLRSGDVIRLGEWVGLVAFEPDEPGNLRPLFPGGWYAGPTLAEAVEPVRRAAVTDLPIVIQGETGSGKEGLARAIHHWSQRSGPFMAVNCAALPAPLAEAELFGHAKGAFTGATQGSPGFFRAAHGGTLLLDEVLDLPLLLQAKLLRVLEQREVQPLGEVRAVPVDVRVLAASQEPLERAVAEGRFRADLLARLDGLTVKIPPLRGRREDIVPLFEHFLSQHGGTHAPKIEGRLVEQLLLYDWPLNVRELLLLVRRLLAVYGGEPALRRSHLPDRMRTTGDARPSAAPPSRRPADDQEHLDILVSALRAHAGNLARAAEAVGISRSRAYRLLEAQSTFDLAAFRAGSEKPSSVPPKRTS
jgi:transcriptional regulator with AAA-type ATPase domain